MSLIRVFQIVLKSGGGLMEGGDKVPLEEGEWEILLVVDFFSPGEPLRRSAFDHLNLFQIKRHHFVNIGHQPV